MIERLTHVWRRLTVEQEAAVAAGTLSPDEAYALTFFPSAFVAAVDAALEAYEQEIASLDPPTDDAVWAAVERVVVTLNGVDLAFGHHIETMTREELSEYIEKRPCRIWYRRRGTAGTPWRRRSRRRMAPLVIRVD